MSHGPYTRTYNQECSVDPIKVRRPDGVFVDLPVQIHNYGADTILELVNEAWRRGWRAGSAAARALLIESARVSAEPEEAAR